MRVKLSLFHILRSMFVVFSWNWIHDCYTNAKIVIRNIHPIQFHGRNFNIVKEKKKRSFPNFSFRVTILNSDGEKFMQSFTDPLFNVTHFANAGLLWIQVQAKGPSGFSNTIHIGKICRKYWTLAIRFLPQKIREFCFFKTWPHLQCLFWIDGLKVSELLTHLNVRSLARQFVTLTGISSRAILPC